jgi:hypothetical protein
MIFKKDYQAHRLAFLWMTGSFPASEVDHINGVRDDNRWGNLRAVTPTQNAQNQRLPSNNKSGVIGVHWNKQANRWCARIKVNGRVVHIGLFSTLEEAVAARAKANEKYGYHPNHGKAL